MQALGPSFVHELAGEAISTTDGSLSFGWAPRASTIGPAIFPKSQNKYDRPCHISKLNLVFGDAVGVAGGKQWN
jgi:hypothetical protein